MPGAAGVAPSRSQGKPYLNIEVDRVAVAGLLPIMWSHSTGSEVMRPLATPVIGGQNRQPRDALAAAARWRFFSNPRPAWCILGPL